MIFGAAYGATSQNRDQPIQIEAASLEMRDKKKEATLSSNVKVVQGDTTMTSEKLVVFYESSSAPRLGAGQPECRCGHACIATVVSLRKTVPPQTR